MQEGGGAFRMRGRGKDRPLVVAQNGQPIGDVGRVIFAELGRELQIGAEESRPEFGDKFFDGIAFVAETLAAEVAVKPLLVPRGMRRLVRPPPCVRLQTPSGNCTLQRNQRQRKHALRRQRPITRLQPRH